MMMKFTKRTFIAAGLSLAMACVSGGVATAESHGKDGISVDNGWTRSRTAAAKVGGAFMEITNGGKSADHLMSAASPIAARVEIHTTKMTDGVMRMVQVKEGVSLAAGETVVFKPGSFHVMLMGLNETLSEGKMFPVTLTFEKAGSVEVMIHVQSAGGMGNMKHGDMNKDSMKKDAMKHGDMKMKKE
jgi:periplasmic copper chaperone A